MKILRTICALTMLLFLSGCVTLTTPPRDENTVFIDEMPVTSEHPLHESLSIRAVDGFVGTSIITLAGRLSPNYDNEQFENVLRKSLVNANLFSDSGNYYLDAKVVTLDNWSDFTDLSIGNKTRNISVKYTLYKNDILIFSEVITGDGSHRNINFVKPYYLVQRDAAEKGYADNIKQLIDKIKNLY